MSNCKNTYFPLYIYSWAWKYSLGLWKSSFNVFSYLQLETHYNSSKSYTKYLKFLMSMFPKGKIFSLFMLQ